MMERDRILHAIEEAPSLPTASMNLLQSLQDPETTVQEVVRLVQLDPGLTTNLLKLANSAFYGFSSRIDSVQQAVVRLGMQAVNRIVLTMALDPVVNGGIEGYDLEGTDFWRHSLITSLLLERMRNKTPKAVPNWIGTAGLLHDIGKVLLGTVLHLNPKPVFKMAFEEKVSFETAEREILGIDHAEVGARLLDTWKLPKELGNAVRHHHAPPAKGGEADWLHLADSLSLSTGLGTGRDGLSYRLDNEAVLRVGLKTSDLESLMAEACMDLDRLMEALSVNGASHQDGREEEAIEKG